MRRDVTRNPKIKRRESTASCTDAARSEKTLALQTKRQEQNSCERQSQCANALRTHTPPTSAPSNTSNTKFSTTQSRFASSLLQQRGPTSAGADGTTFPYSARTCIHCEPAFADLVSLAVDMPQLGADSKTKNCRNVFLQNSFLTSPV